MSTLAFATIKELREKLDKNEISSKELVEYYSDRFKKYNSKLGAALEVFDTDSILKDNNGVGSLAGIPGIIKDNIAQKNRKMTCASKILENFVSPYDATATKRLKEAGATLMGRANLDEFAMGSSNETSAFGKAYNPWNLECVPGGSSGGSAVAVAAGLVPWALGSETGGSVRLPASFCGITGLKPTYGLVSRYGLTAYASSLDQIGVFTRSVEDNATVLSVLAGRDFKDSTSLQVDSKDFNSFLTGKLKPGLKIGVIKNTMEAEGMDPEIKEAIEKSIKFYEEQGASITYLDINALNYSAAAYFIISRAEAASNLARFDGVRYGYRNKDAKTLEELYSKSRHDGFGQEVRSRILVGNYVLSAGHSGEFYDNAKKVQRLIRKQLIDTFAKVDVLISPTHAAPAFKFGAFDENKLQMDLQDYFTCFANMAGVPALSIPCGFTKDKMPIGFQLVGPHLSEGLLYQTAQVYEQATDWHKMHPANFE